MSFHAIILAAGQGSRLARAGVSTRKQFLDYRGNPLFWHSARILAAHPQARGLVFVFPHDDPEAYANGASLVENLYAQDDPGVPYSCVAGGPRRQDSVFNALSVLPPEASHVLVHDAARPFITPALVEDLVNALEQGRSAVIPAITVTDTIKVVDDEGRVTATPDRSTLRAVQTPQAFDLALLKRAHLSAQRHGYSVTDDASMVEALDEPVFVVPGREGNIKITNPEDLHMLERNTAIEFVPCMAWGYDVHRYVAKDTPKARPMMLGGVPIPGAPHVQAHSDGDVLLHALADALLGLLAQGDIGDRYPDSSEEFEGMESGVFVADIMQDIRKADIRLTHADLTIIAQTPRLADHKRLIRTTVAGLLDLPEACVNVKATTEEKLGFTGEKKGIKAAAAVTGMKPSA